MTLSLARPDLENTTGVGPEIPRPRAERRPGTDTSFDLVEHWGVHSFPASDPPANW